MKRLFLVPLLVMAACLDTPAESPPIDERAVAISTADDLQLEVDEAYSIPGWQWWCLQAPVCIVAATNQECRAQCAAAGVPTPKCIYREEWPPTCP